MPGRARYSEGPGGGPSSSSAIKAAFLSSFPTSAPVPDRSLLPHALPVRAKMPVYAPYTVFVVNELDMLGSHWREVKRMLAIIVPFCSALDCHQGGVSDVFFLNHAHDDREPGFVVASEESVEELPDPAPADKDDEPAGVRLQGYLEHLESLRGTPVRIVFLTRGAPPWDIEEVLCSAAAKLREAGAPWFQLAVHLVQFGTDPEVTAALDGLRDAVPGVVKSVMPYNRRKLMTALMPRMLAAEEPGWEVAQVDWEALAVFLLEFPKDEDDLDLLEQALHHAGLKGSIRPGAPALLWR